jgi:hypothetical protein
MSLAIPKTQIQPVQHTTAGLQGQGQQQQQQPEIWCHPKTELDMMLPWKDSWGPPPSMDSSVPKLTHAQKQKLALQIFLKSEVEAVLADLLALLSLEMRLSFPRPPQPAVPGTSNHRRRGSSDLFSAALRDSIQLSLKSFSHHALTHMGENDGKLFAPDLALLTATVRDAAFVLLAWSGSSGLATPFASEHAVELLRCGLAELNKEVGDTDKPIEAVAHLLLLCSPYLDADGSANDVRSATNLRGLVKGAKTVALVSSCVP